MERRAIVSRLARRAAAARLGANQALARRSLAALPPEEIFALLSAFTPLAGSRGDPMFVLPTADRVIARCLFVDGSYQEDHIAWILGYLGQPQRAKSIIEVGGNIGSTTVSFLSRHRARHVVTFEPEPLNCRILRCNLVLNGLEESATVLCYAISDRDDSLTLELEAKNLGDHRIRMVDLAGEHGEEARPTTVVFGRRLDTVLSEIGVSAADLALVWVDTQGHEAQVLSGAAVTASSGTPWVIEYWPYGLARATGADALHRAVQEHFTSFIDVRNATLTGRPTQRPIDDVASLANTLGWGDFTDLLLLP